MSRHRFSRRVLCHAAAATVLLIGLLSAAYLYWQAGNVEDGALVYEFAGGNVYLVDPADSKMYRHDLERFGGKAAVFADDLNRWLSSLWKGRRFAILLAILSILAALMLYRAGKKRGSSDEAPDIS